MHGTRCHVSFVKRWGLFGRRVPRIRAVAVNVACAECLYAFVLRPGRWTEAPAQTAHDALMRVQGQLAEAPPAADGDKPPLERKAAPMPRPAPDPRVKRR